MRRLAQVTRMAADYARLEPDSAEWERMARKADRLLVLSRQYLDAIKGAGRQT